EDQLLFYPRDQLLRLYHLVTIHTHTDRALSHEKLYNLRIVRRRLSTYGRSNTRFPADPDNMTHRPQHRQVSLVIDLLDRRVIPVNAKDEHRQIVRPERYPVNTLLNKLVDQQYNRRDLAHDPELEIRPTLQNLLLHNLLRIPELLQCTDERQH